MNLARFGLRLRPFRPTPDTQSYYPATPHEYALEHLIQAVADDEGLALLTGDAGTGKTLLAHLLLERLGNEVSTSLITNCRFATRADLLRTVLFDLNQPHQGLTEQELRLALTGHVLDQFAADKRTVLVFDEAQDLTPDLLEELRLLGNLESGRGKAVHVLLVSQPAILETLRRPELAVVSQRLSVRLRLEPLDVHESADYLLHQIRIAGGRPGRVVTDEAVLLLAKNAHGVPRVLNQAGHQALILADSLQAEQVDVEVVIEALAVLGIEAELDADPALPTQPRLAADAPEHDGIEPAPSAFGLAPPAEFAPQAHDGDWASEAYVFHPPGEPVQLVYGTGPG
jgi:type II secretory pathway predicted ATPase ExeA